MKEWCMASRLFAWGAALVVLAGQVWAQPSYLVPLLNEIERTNPASFYTVTFRLYERVGAGVYSPEDLRFLSSALLRRAEASPELLPVVLPLLGQMNVPETVPPIMTHARSSDQAVRTAAYQALGWMGDERALPLLTARNRQERPAASAEERFMIEYATRSIELKARLRRMSSGDQFGLVRTTLLTEPNWLVRGDIARMLSKRAGADVWAVLFDSYERWATTPQYVQMIGEVLGQRYRFDPTGYIAAVRRRPPETRLYALERISDFPHISDMGAIMDISETDSDPIVRECATILLGKLLNR